MVKIRNFKAVALIALFLLFISGLIWQYKALKSYFVQVRIENIQLMNLPGNRLRFKVTVTCNVNAKTFLKYWKVNSRDTLYSDISSSNETDTLNISNAEAETHYKLQVVAFNHHSQYVSNVHDFQTQLIYHATPYFDLEYMDSRFEPVMHDKYFLTQILSEPGSLVIINKQGNIVWYQPFQKGVKVSHWTSRGTILCIVGYEKIPSSGGDEIYEINVNGKVLRHLKVGKGDMDKLVHHEVRFDDKNNLYALTFTKKTFDLTSVKGLKKDTVHGDGIVVFNQSGKKIWEWSILDHLNPVNDPKILKTKKDWVHANSLFKDKDGNFLISFRDLSQLWKVEYPSGKILWKLGEGGDFSMSGKDKFSGQHAIHINEYGQLMMLDNGAKNKLSRAMTFDLDTIHKNAIAKSVVPLSKEYFSATKGSAALLDHDKVLFCLTDPRVFLVEDKDGKILWKVNLAGDPYRIEEAKGFLKAKPSINE